MISSGSSPFSATTERALRGPSRWQTEFPAITRLLELFGSVLEQDAMRLPSPSAQPWKTFPIRKTIPVGCFCRLRDLSLCAVVRVMHLPNVVKLGNLQQIPLWPKRSGIHDPLTQLCC